jgi:hypothetical protein
MTVRFSSFSAPISLYRAHSRDNTAILWKDLRPKLPPEVPETPERRKGLLFGLSNRENFDGLRDTLNSWGPMGAESYLLAAWLETKMHPEKPEMARGRFQANDRKVPDQLVMLDSMGRLRDGPGKLCARRGTLPDRFGQSKPGIGAPSVLEKPAWRC